MNNGNLLNTLMGATGANPASAKTTAAKNRVDASEKFQQTLNQVRPEVAARKPVARKDPAVAERSDLNRAATKSSTQRPSPHEANRTSAHKNTSAERKAAASLERNNSPKQDLNSHQSADVRKNSPQDIAGDSNGPLKAHALTEAIDGNANVGLSDLAVPAETGFGVDVLLLSVDAESLEFTDAPVDEGLLAQDPGLLAGHLTVPSDSLQGDKVGLAPLLASAQTGLGQVAANAIAAAQPAVGQGVAMAGKGLDGLNTDIAAGELTEEGDLAVDMDTGENPDFLLLNSKAALNKLAETAMAAADKPAPAADLAKPLVAGAAVESLARLTEGQSPAARAFVVQTGVPVTVGTPQWSQAVGDKVLWLAAQNVSSAEIRLDPPELGPMQVRVSVNQDQASITFTSPHPAVRDALDQQLNRLREMFSEQGMNLVNVDVSDRSFAQQERERGEADKRQSTADGDDDTLAPTAITQAISMRLVDHYA